MCATAARQVRADPCPTPDAAALGAPGARSYHRAMATSATVATTLADRSDRGKLALVGPDAAVFLNGQVTNDVEALAPGEGCYAALLTNKGKMLADLRLLRTEDGVLLDCERVALQASSTSCAAPSSAGASSCTSARSRRPCSPSTARGRGR